jgi:hypothetical protein
MARESLMLVELPRICDTHPRSSPISVGTRALAESNGGNGGDVEAAGGKERANKEGKQGSPKISRKAACAHLCAAGGQ